MSKTVLISHRAIFTSQFRWAAVWDWSLVGGRPSGVVGREKVRLEMEVCIQLQRLSGFSLTTQGGPSEVVLEREGMRLATHLKTTCEGGGHLGGVVRIPFTTQVRAEETTFFSWSCGREGSGRYSEPPAPPSVIHEGSLSLLNATSVPCLVSDAKGITR